MLCLIKTKTCAKVKRERERDRQTDRDRERDSMRPTTLKPCATPMTIHVDSCRAKHA